MPHKLQPETASDVAANIVKKFEGLHKVLDDGRVRSYRCPAGKWTIGYGHTKGVRSNMHITQETAEEWLHDDLAIYTAAVRRNVNVPLSQNQLDALVSWTFNLGEGNLKSSTMLRKLNAGDYASVPIEMARWNKATVDGKKVSLPGLVRRRAAEGALFTMDSDAGDVTPQPQKIVPPPRNKSLAKSRTLIGSVIAATAVAVNHALEALEPMRGQNEYVDTALAVLAMVGIGISIYARVDDHLKAKDA